MTTDEMAESTASPSQPDLQAEAKAVGSKLTDLEQEARTLIRKRPVVAVLTAAGVGYLMARLVTRGVRRAR